MAWLTDSDDAKTREEHCCMFRGPSIDALSRVWRDDYAVQNNYFVSRKQERMQNEEKTSDNAKKHRKCIKLMATTLPLALVKLRNEMRWSCRWCRPSLLIPPQRPEDVESEKTCNVV